jgi:hypothetical protein
MACLFEAKIEDLKPGSEVGLPAAPGSYVIIDWGVKLEPKEDCPYNVAMKDGRLLAIPDGTEVMSGYGFGHR